MASRWQRLERLSTRAEGALLALGILIASLVAVAWQSGGYFPYGYLRTGAIVAFAVAGLLVFRPPVARVSREAMIALAALLAVTVWTWIARSWSPASAAGLADAQRDLVYVAIFALAVLAAGSGRAAGLGTLAVLGAVSVIVIAGLVHRLFPSAPSNPDDYRLSYPLDYWNAYGALAAMAVVIAVGVAADNRLRAALRALAAGLATLAFVALYLSLSRGAFLALGCGLVVLVLICPRRPALLGALLLVGGAAAVALLRLHSLPALVDNPDVAAGQAATGRQFAPLLGLIAVICAAGQFLFAKLERTAGRHLLRARRRSGLPKPSPLVVGLAVAVVLACVVVALAPQIGHQLSRAWNSSGQGGSSLAGSARLTTLETSRHDAYQVGIKEWKSAPLAGVGSGGYRVGWYRYRDVEENIVNAHSLYIETLAELGLIGLALLLAFVASLIAAAVRTRLKPVGLSRTRASAVIAAMTVWLVHTGIDWDWQMTTLTGLALLLVAMLLPRARAGERAANQVLWRYPARTAVGFGCCACAFLAVGVYLWAGAAQARRLDDANRLGAAGRYAQSLALARSVSMAPAGAGAKLTEAYDLQDLGDKAQAVAAYRAAVVADPNDWTLRIQWAQALLQVHRRAHAHRELLQAERLNPLLRSELQLLPRSSRLLFPIPTAPPASQSSGNL